ncbi:MULTISPECIES: M15 family metallopeptidase [Uliginosibacterium]|uniref:M15 family metallopeptidase n=1 Tax=Uliginosibacterium aquaticum TaxID=2731212 RepID=A0ABX2IMR1_9RHOO|nr:MULTISPECIES: M15 family metallopeptidase [Uliginosibacterium]MDO6384666.1 M15 family metallopeptidase [Uliginosibacterium sp. 31-12]NSL55601.1 M15 family metallopeptidase [Uliginosibacterium aquaticum]PLK48385.1 hypothetical protein C0V76_09895 [Uliginosibacterium sp. TH139]
MKGWRSGTTLTGDGVSRLREELWQYRLWWLGAAAFLLIPLLVLLLLREDINVGSFADAPRGGDAVIAALLAGERLVPPPPLPPDSFTTVEVLTLRPALANASRDWGLLDDGFSQRLLHVFQRMHEHGYEMALLEGYRSPERQDQLAAMGGHVTNAKAFQSYHQYGMAADVAFVRNGKLVISEKDPWAMRGYELYGQEAEAMGLTWGGRWKMMDFGHVELRGTTRLPSRTDKSPATL